MNLKALNHVLRAAQNLLPEKLPFLIVGSQAILAHLDPTNFSSDVLFVSDEVDVVAMGIADKDERDKISDMLSGTIGEHSLFHQTFGYYIDGVGMETAVLAPGWEARLVKVSGVESDAYALSFADLAFSKLMAGRQKDLAFVKDMCATRHPQLERVMAWLQEMPIGPVTELARKRWGAMWPTLRVLRP